MFNIFSHQGNINQKDTEISSHPSQNTYHQEKQQMLAKIGEGRDCW
jgi:hypothetical protein